MVAREIELHRRAFILLAVDGHVAAGLLDEAVDHAEAKTGAAAGVLGGEEGLEHPFQCALGHARAAVADRDHDVLAGRDLGVGGCVGLVQQGVGRLDGQTPSIGHGVPGVDGQVQDGVFELVLVGFDGPQAWGQDALQFDLLAQGPVQQFRHVPDQAVDVQRLGLQRLPAREGEEPAREVRGPLRALQRHVERAFDAGLLAGLGPANSVQAPDDHREQVVEVVRHAPRELADRLHLLGLAQGLLRLGAAGHLRLDAILQAGVQRLQLRLGLTPLFQLARGRLEQPGVVHGDRGLAGQSHEPLLGRFGEHAGLRMAEEEAAQRLAGA